MRIIGIDVSREKMLLEPVRVQKKSFILHEKKLKINCEQTIYCAPTIIYNTVINFYQNTFDLLVHAFELVLSVS